MRASSLVIQLSACAWGVDGSSKSASSVTVAISSRISAARSSGVRLHGNVGDDVGETDGGMVGGLVGIFVGTGDGAGVGLTVGPGDGGEVGLGVGLLVGLNVGPGVGGVVGSGVGVLVGLGVGPALGLRVGLRVGFRVGPGVGLRLGGGVGTGVIGTDSCSTLDQNPISSVKSSFSKCSNNRAFDLLMFLFAFFFSNFLKLRPKGLSLTLFVECGSRECTHPSHPASSSVERTPIALFSLLIIILLAVGISGTVSWSIMSLVNNVGCR